ncbi:MAG: CpsD/CapB family tyrosine-protein kinase [Clostridiales bacterium]|nr:CpsD/CapB family tyrosine-protein kinase [Clostridiales bacterium]
MGENLNFAAKEAYKRLRTNVMFSFADEKECRIIGITSSIRGEGKSTTSSNLAYSFAEMGKKVLLIDADMRLSQIHKIFEMSQSPGLSNLLAGVSNGSNIVRGTEYHKNLSIISAGDTVPNPTELLSSRRMSATLELLSSKYDIIILDLPPIDAVSDALIVSGLLHGMIVVTRQNYVDKRALKSAMNQLKFHNVNVLGFVVNCVDVNDGYYKKRYGSYARGGYYYGKSTD